jgi:hypothetical protein
VGGEDRPDDAEVLISFAQSRKRHAAITAWRFSLEIVEEPEAKRKPYPAAKAALQIIVCGTAEAVPLSKTENSYKLLRLSEKLEVE